MSYYTQHDCQTNAIVAMFYSEEHLLRHIQADGIASTDYAYLGLNDNLLSSFFKKRTEIAMKGDDFSFVTNIKDCRNTVKGMKLQTVIGIHIENNSVILAPCIV